MDIGGVPDHVMTLARGLRGEFDVSVLCASIDPRHARELDRLGVPVITVPFARLPSPLADLRALITAAAEMRRHRFDVVHTHMSKAVLVGATAARLTRVPLVINTAHNLGFLALPNPALRALFWIYDKMLFWACCDVIVTVSESVRAGVVRGRIASDGKVVAIANGIDPDRFNVPPEVRRDTRTLLSGSDGPLIVTVARLVWFKGLDTLIDAVPALLARHPRARIAIVGDGPLREILEARADALGLADRIVFLGERRDVPEILAAADIFVLPSVSEGMPISILEAMAASRPVVATRVGGVPDLVSEDETGIVVPARDPEALSAALIRLADDPALAGGMGAAGRQRLDASFSAQAMVTRTAVLYRRGPVRASRPTAHPACP